MNFGSKYWDKRSEKYKNLDWVNNKNCLNSLIKFCNLKKFQKVLDVGTGTGIIAQECLKYTDLVMGLDYSEKMVDIENTDIPIVPADVRNIPLVDNGFDRVIARLVFHHVTKDIDKAIQECWRVLKPKGKIIICEGVPPLDCLRKDYEEIFKLKEERLVFCENDLIELISRYFKNIKTKSFVQEQVSVNNWLNNDPSLSTKTKKMIISLHRNASITFKDAYNLTDTGEDILIDLKFVAVKGTAIK